MCQLKKYSIQRHVHRSDIVWDTIASMIEQFYIGEVNQLTNLLFNKTIYHLMLYFELFPSDDLHIIDLTF